MNIRETIRSNIWIIVGVAAILAVGFFGAYWWASSEVVRTREERIRAEEQAKAAAQRVVEIEAENRIKDEAAKLREEERKKEAAALAEALRQATAALAVSAETERRKQRELEASRETRRLNLEHVASQTDQEMVRAISGLALSVYPEESRGMDVRAVADGVFEMNRSGAETMNRALIDVGGLREEVTKLTEISNERGVQVQQLNLTSDTQKKQIVSLNLSIQDQNERIDRLAQTVEAVKGETLQERQLRRASENEFSAYRRKQKFNRVRNTAISVGLAGLAFYAGSKVGNK